MNRPAKQGDQHEHRTAQGIQEEVERRALPVGPTQTVDQEEQRNQRRFPEDVEQRPVARREHAEHGRFEQQDEDEIEPCPLLHAPRDEYGDQRQQGSEQHHGQRDAVHPEGEIGAEPDIPGTAFEHLHRRPGRVELAGQPQCVTECGKRECHGPLPQGQGTARR